MKKIILIEILLLGLMTISISMSIFGRNVATKSIYFQVNMTEELAKGKRQKHYWYQRKYRSTKL